MRPAPCMLGGESMASIVHNEQVEEALTFARRELRLAPLASTPPLVHAIVRAAFEHLTAKHDWELRLALWMVLAVALKARTHEGCPASTTIASAAPAVKPTCPCAATTSGDSSGMHAVAKATCGGATATNSEWSGKRSGRRYCG